MRTFFTWRFWVTLLALVGLALGVRAFADQVDVRSEVATAVLRRFDEHRIDLIAPVFLVQGDRGVAIRNGVTTGRLQVRVDGYRYMNIPPGTPGENRCGALDQLASCVVAANLLGESVLWFTFLPAEPRNLVTLPPIKELRKESLVLLENGWVVRRADTVKRVCDDETSSLSDFVRRDAKGGSSTFSLDLQRLTTVTCPVVTETTTTTLLTTTVPETDSGTGETVDTASETGETSDVTIDTVTVATEAPPDGAGSTEPATTRG